MPQISDVELEIQCRRLSEETGQQQQQQTTPPNYSRPSAPLYQLDTVLFFTSYQPNLHDHLLPVAAASAALPTPVSTSSKVNRKSQQTTTTGPDETSTAVFSLRDVTDGVDVDLLRAIFVGCDALILIYRFTLTCWTIRALRRRFDPRCFHPSPLSSAANRYHSDSWLQPVHTAAVAADGDATLMSFRSGLMTSTSAGGSEYRLCQLQQQQQQLLVEQQQQAAGRDATNIYTDPQTLVMQSQNHNNHHHQLQQQQLLYGTMSSSASNNLRSTLTRASHDTTKQLGSNAILYTIRRLVT